MCSMALVHARLSRVVYCQSDTQHGALGGKLRLHAERSLNHHYMVYQLPAKHPPQQHPPQQPSQQQQQHLHTQQCQQQPVQQFTAGTVVPVVVGAKAAQADPDLACAVAQARKLAARLLQTSELN